MQYNCKINTTEYDVQVFNMCSKADK